MERGKKEDWAERSSDLSAVLRRSPLAQGKGEATESECLLQESFAGRSFKVLGLLCSGRAWGPVWTQRPRCWALSALGTLTFLLRSAWISMAPVPHLWQASLLPASVGYFHLRMPHQGPAPHPN